MATMRFFAAAKTKTQKIYFFSVFRGHNGEIKIRAFFEIHF
jgi:hypothetical protein